MKNPKISIIIPTLNEEKYLPKLLNSISKQTFSDYEIIVSDAGSTDRTKSIAKEFGAKIVTGGLPGVGRNNGARVAKGEFLFFFDSDVKLPIGFLQKIYNEMQERFLDLATCDLKPLSNLALDKVMHESANLIIRIYQYSRNPIVSGSCIFVSKRLFNRVNGFDEKLRMKEDHDFVERASMFRHFRVLDSSYIKLSVRRMKKEGRLVLMKKYAEVEFYHITKGPVTKDIANYKFADYENKYKGNLFEKRLQKMESDMHKIKREYKRFRKEFLIGERLKQGYEKTLMRLKKKIREKF